MAIIGWASLAIVVGALIYLGVSGFSTYKSMKPKIDHLQAVSERLKATQQVIQSETDKLKSTQENIKQDIDQKKEAMLFTVEAAKKTPQSMKQLGTAMYQLVDENVKLKLPVPKRKRQTEHA
ncbi:septum formation initiator family protein [Bacillus badius]|uniref:DUF948 domain-containing protein n=1 Tax=Bacillus badius TaxID=1455 RepID=A0ABR5AQ66_BACBA|nr:septum formation initiator family protein [Bacillus badius]KIL72145.1 hypothetical protein SD78_0934 [Bacillus badius]KIL76911.1 hypothetical protein SD77_1871 [Bacillus badius]KZR58214.1 hypothetical protein A3781_18610 [Bacillus badius]MED0665427.1 septum formation initiator family protein [Bacillus badius]MED4717753.1 septum formation initiator family protein [Bacillus badius]